MKTQLLSRATKDSLDEELFQYNRIAKEIAIRKVELETQREHDENIGGGRSSIISKPVENLVIKYENDARIKYLRELQANVEECYRQLTEEQKTIFDLRWLLEEVNTWEEIAGKMHYTTKHIYRKREKILEKYAKVKGMV